jgi:Patatin-like phospholipase
MTPAQSSYDLSGEAEAIAARRQALGVASTSAAELPTVGLALSGGGIRSATYSLGVIRGLAKNGLLKRIDYVSSVSGGGYTAAMLGRLFTGQNSTSADENVDTSATIKEACASLSNYDSLLLWWLRANGRYLSPAGSKDLAIGFVTYTRAIVAVHLELGLMTMLFACFMVVPHVLNYLSLVDVPSQLGMTHSIWFGIAAALSLAVIPGLLLGYWQAKDDAPEHHRKTSKGTVATLVFFSVVAMAAVLYFSWLELQFLQTGKSANASASDRGSIMGLSLLVLSMTIGIATQKALKAAGKDAATSRLIWTRCTRACVTINGLLIMAGVIDLASWQLFKAIVSDEGVGWLGPLSLTAGITLIKVITPKLISTAQARSSTKVAPLRVSLVIGLAGTFIVIAVLLIWSTLVQGLVFWNPPVKNLPWWELGVEIRWAICTMALIFWLLFTGKNRQTPNATSLHSLYRARLTRAYLSVANRARFGAQSPSLSVKQADLSAVRNVTEIVAGDDVALRDYRPEGQGGPIHLINCCLNQSRANGSNLFQADRKGDLLTVSHRGIEIGASQFIAQEQAGPMGTLGQWIAISGAAASTGAGSMGVAGWSMTMVACGARLGYWWPAPHTAAPINAIADFFWDHFPKQTMLLKEATGAFYGTATPSWYLSDGGHYENTAIYPLLKRQCRFIIAADCGSDPAYEFADLENLMRKARVDLGCNIEFYSGVDAQRLYGEAKPDLSILPPDELQNHFSAAGVLLGKIRYCDSTEATLLILKPSLHKTLPLDIINYARANSQFPQQATSDQFFDEAQWESYHRLGLDLSSKITASWLDMIPCWRLGTTHATIAPHPFGKSASQLEAESVAKNEAEKNWRLTSKAAAVGATLSLGALGSVGLVVSQLADQIRTQTQAQAKEFDTAVDNFHKTVLLAPEIKTKPLLLKSSLTRIKDVAESTLSGKEVRSRADSFLDDIDQSCVAKSAAADICDALPSKKNGIDAYQYLQQEAASLGVIRKTVFNQMIAKLTLSAKAPHDVAIADPITPAPPSAANSSCSGNQNLRLYVHIYNESQRKGAQKWMELVTNKFGQTVGSIQVQGLENINASAVRQDRSKPVPWGNPTLIVHDGAGMNCAQALAESLKKWYPEPIIVKTLPANLKAVSGVIEAYLPSKSFRSEAN